MNTLRLRLSVVNGLDQPLAPANLDEIALLDTSAQKRSPGVVAEAQLFDVDPVAPGNHEPIRRASQPSGKPKRATKLWLFRPPRRIESIYTTQWLT